MSGMLGWAQDFGALLSYLMQRQWETEAERHQRMFEREAEEAEAAAEQERGLAQARSAELRRQIEGKSS